jgi:hypothetical protein
MLALGLALLRAPLSRGARAMSRALAGRRHAESPLVVELRARVADKDAELRARIADKDARIADKEKIYALACEAHAKDAAALHRAADEAKGRITVRAMLEACVEDIAASHGGGLSSAPRSEQLKRLLAKDGCVGFSNYLRVVASDNSIKEADILKQAPALYGALSRDLHAEEAGGTTSVPAALFDPHGRTKMVAMAAIARFTGRNLALYGDAKGSPVPIKLRVLSPLQRAACVLSIEEVRAAPVVEF